MGKLRVTLMLPPVRLLRAATRSPSSGASFYLVSRVAAPAASKLTMLLLRIVLGPERISRAGSPSPVTFAAVSGAMVRAVQVTLSVL